jgi:hypothetical protein
VLKGEGGKGKGGVRGITSNRPAGRLPCCKHGVVVESVHATVGQAGTVSRRHCWSFKITCLLRLLNVNSIVERV